MLCCWCLIIFSHFLDMFTSSSHVSQNEPSDQNKNFMKSWNLSSAGLTMGSSLWVSSGTPLCGDVQIYTHTCSLVPSSCPVQLGRVFPLLKETENRKRNVNCCCHLQRIIKRCTSQASSCKKCLWNRKGLSRRHLQPHPHVSRGSSYLLVKINTQTTLLLHNKMMKMSPHVLSGRASVFLLTELWKQMLVVIFITSYTAGRIPLWVREMSLIK